jgi:hypothetical protein
MRQRALVFNTALVSMKGTLVDRVLVRYGIAS